MGSEELKSLLEKMSKQQSRIADCLKLLNKRITALERAINSPEPVTQTDIDALSEQSINPHCSICKFPVDDPADRYTDPKTGCLLCRSCYRKV